MRPNPEQAAEAAGSYARDKTAPFAVSVDWLATFDGSAGLVFDQAMADLAQRRARLAQDADLMSDLAAVDFAGEDYDRFEQALAEYGMAVIGAWIVQGRIFQRYAERCRGTLPDPPPGMIRSPGLAQELTNDTVAIALHHFRTDVLMENRWDPKKGASLKTYFIGQCLIRFANVYTKRRAYEMRNEAVLVDDLALIERDLPDHRTDPADLAVLRQLIDTRMKNAPEHVRKIMVLTAADWPQRDIAVELGMTEKAVERTLAYHRSLMRKAGAA